VLEAFPYGIVDGESIYARIQCQNIIGMSLTSEINNGAINPSVPDAPLTLTCSSNAGTSSSISWQAGLSDGGAPLLCYRINVQQESLSAAQTFNMQTYEYCGATIDGQTVFNQRTFTANGLTQGARYIFTVYATNIAG
jgi:hypothetical protein